MKRCESLKTKASAQHWKTPWNACKWWNIHHRNMTQFKDCKVVPSLCRVFLVAFWIFAVWHLVVSPTPGLSPGEMMNVMYCWCLGYNSRRYHGYPGYHTGRYCGTSCCRPRVCVSMMMNRRWNHTKTKHEGTLCNSEQFLRAKSGIISS